MGFMQRQVYQGEFYLVEFDNGSTECVPVQVSGHVETNGELADYVEGRVDDPEGEPELHTGFYGRFSAPGYMDRTDWVWAETEQEVIDQLGEMYGEDDDEGEEECSHLDTLGYTEDGVHYERCRYCGDDVTEEEHDFDLGE